MGESGVQEGRDRRSVDRVSSASGADLLERDAASARLRPRGSNHVGMRQFNERVVLQAIRLHGSLPKADIARLTRLTPQTVQVIIARLEADGLVHKLAPLRGKIGQPSVPMALDPDGAFSIGIKIGRRSMDMLLLDFAGQVRERLSLSYEFPDPDTLFADIESRLKQLRLRLPAALRSRLHGVGIAAPLSLGGWQALLGIEPRQALRWADIDIRERVASMTELPVEFVKDTAAACVAAGAPSCATETPRDSRCARKAPARCSAKAGGPPASAGAARPGSKAPVRRRLCASLSSTAASAGFTALRRGSKLKASGTSTLSGPSSRWAMFTGVPSNHERSQSRSTPSGFWPRAAARGTSRPLAEPSAAGGGPDAQPCKASAAAIKQARRGSTAPC